MGWDRKQIKVKVRDLREQLNKWYFLGINLTISNIVYFVDWMSDTVYYEICKSIFYYNRRKKKYLKSQGQMGKLFTMSGF